jgi:hypothetical protein
MRLWPRDSSLLMFFYFRAKCLWSIKPSESEISHRGDSELSMRLARRVFAVQDKAMDNEAELSAVRHVPKRINMSES